MLPGLETAELPADAIEVGRILDAWGIKGWFKVLPYSADPEALFFFPELVSSSHRKRCTNL
jgi:16S rRNA processing protein RimM